MTNVPKNRRNQPGQGLEVRSRKCKPLTPLMDARTPMSTWAEGEKSCTLKDLWFSSGSCQVASRALRLRAGA